jgi:LuxR family maltose regulon positive regulatory protein
VYLALARLRYEQDDLAGSQENIQQAHELAVKAGWTHISWRIHMLQAQVCGTQGDTAGVEQALWLIDQLLVQYRVAWVERLVDTCRARLALLAGDLAAAEAWAEDYEALDADEVLPVFEELTLAQVYLAGGRAQAALHILDLLEAALRSGGGGRAMVEMLVMRALALWRLKRGDEALRILLQAAPYENLARPFLDQRRALAELVESLPTQSRPEFLKRLLVDESSPASDTAAAPELHQDLIDPLSRRELEVLALIADGLSNPEIAERLYLSVNTLRAHTTHIYQKLDVHNRVQAVSRARQLGLLPRN